MKEKNISIKLSLDENCKFEYTNENDDYDDSIELLFEHVLSMKIQLQGFIFNVIKLLFLIK